MTEQWILDLNDVQTRVWRGEELVYGEPAVALVGKKGAVTGDAAMANCRLEPAHFFSKFIDKYNQESISTPSRVIAHQADLLFEFLADIKKKCQFGSEEVWIAIASDITSAQLALLYGVAQAAEITVRDFADRSMAMAAGAVSASAASMLHLGMHRTVITHFQVEGDLNRRAVHGFAEPGFARFLNSWVQVVTHRFLQSSRFDPRRFGETEQQVLNRLWAFSRGEEELGVFDLTHRGETRQAEVSESDLALGAEGTFSSLAPHLSRVSKLLAEGYALAVPGMRAFLRSLNIEPIELEPHAIVDGIAAIRTVSAGDTDNRRLHVNFPAPGDHQILSPSTSPEKLCPPTHLLYDATAVALRNSTAPASIFDGVPESVDFRVRSINGAVMLDPGSAAGLEVNGAAIDAATALCAGDVIDFHGHRFRCITVNDGG